jgi:hypothetical protein
MFRRNRCSVPITIFFCTHAVAASLGCMQKRWIPRMLLFWCDHAHDSIRTVHAAPSSSWQVVHQSIKNTISTVEDRKERVCRCLIRHPDRFAVFDLDTAIQFGTREPRFSGHVLRFNGYESRLGSRATQFAGKDPSGVPDIFLTMRGSWRWQCASKSHTPEGRDSTATAPCAGADAAVPCP